MQERTPLDMPVITGVQGVLGHPGATELYIFQDGGVYGRTSRYGGDLPVEAYLHPDGSFEYPDGSAFDLAAQRDEMLGLAARILHPTYEAGRLALLRFMSINPR